MSDTMLATKSERVVCEASLSPSSATPRTRIRCSQCNALVHIKIDGVLRKHTAGKKKPN